MVIKIIGHKDVHYFERDGVKSVVYLMDCMDGMKQIPDKYFDIAVVDPPYRDENQPTKDMRTNGSMQTIQGRPPKLYWNNLNRLSKERVVWGANNFQMPQFKGFLVWKKQTIGESFTMSMCEIASISEGLGTTSKWIEIAPQDKHRFHPTQKPVKLYDWIYKNYGQDCKRVLDTHLGSQSNRIAAFKAGIDFMGFELDEDYYRDGNKRFENFSKQLTLL